jgi:hypothetical protein
VCLLLRRRSPTSLFRAIAPFHLLVTNRHRLRSFRRQPHPSLLWSLSPDPAPPSSDPPFPIRLPSDLGLLPPDPPPLPSISAWSYLARIATSAGATRASAAGRWSCPPLPQSCSHLVATRSALGRSSSMSSYSHLALLATFSPPGRLLVTQVVLLQFGFVGDILATRPVALLLSFLPIAWRRTSSHVIVRQLWPRSPPDPAPLWLLPDPPSVAGSSSTLWPELPT